VPYQLRHLDIGGVVRTYEKEGGGLAFLRDVMRHGSRAAALIRRALEAERVYASDSFPNVRPFSALKARACIARRRLDEVLDWTREQGLSVADGLSYLREYEHIRLARVLLARRSIVEAPGRLERLLRAANDGAGIGSVIVILVLQALGHQAKGNVRRTRVPLECALILAEPGGYVRAFVDERQPLRSLLDDAAKHGIAANYARQLLAAFGMAEDRMPLKHAQIEPLSERELDVLRLLRTDLDGTDIARDLMVSLSTIRTHTRNIYSKLGVNNRRAAVRRAGELDLLSQHPTQQRQPVVVHGA